uniref:Uncharacterized protein n=1 Tax=Vitrella brassicaformis TaxID=1169539 RepID=A0A7S1JLD0_9ALVE
MTMFSWTDAWKATLEELEKESENRKADKGESRALPKDLTKWIKARVDAPAEHLSTKPTMAGPAHGAEQIPGALRAECKLPTIEKLPASLRLSRELLARIFGFHAI